LANAIEQSPKELGEPSQWQAEWKWDGIRTQVIRRSGKTFLWSRGEELLTDRFPDLRASFAKLPDGTVLDGEIVAYREGRILSFAKLQRRIGLKKLIRKVVCEVPVAFFAFDLLEVQGEDIREQPLEIRRERLVLLGREWAPTSQANFDEFRLSNEEFFPEPDNLKIPPLVPFDHWEELAAARAQCRSEMAEGIMLKRRDSPYRAGRPRGDWWKWKIDPYSIDAVLVYAERGHGRRAGLYSDYTFAIWQGEELVPFAKAYSGLTNAELKQVDAFVRLHTLERFGPMVKVQPELVFEIGFESIQASHRHKSGYAVRFPRILAWRHDKKPTDADHVDRIQALLRES
jgi:DNA ligase-1